MPLSQRRGVGLPACPSTVIYLCANGVTLCIRMSSEGRQEVKLLAQHTRGLVCPLALHFSRDFKRSPVAKRILKVSSGRLTQSQPSVFYGHTPRLGAFEIVGSLGRVVTERHLKLSLGKACDRTQIDAC